MRRILVVVLVACYTVFMCCSIVAFAATVAVGAQATEGFDSAKDQDDIGDVSSISKLSDRYATLDELATTKNSDSKAIVDTTVDVLTAANRALDDLPVRFSGEVVGNRVIADPGYSWVNIQGSAGSSIGVYLDNEDADTIVKFGDYTTTGSTLEIEGVYSVDCADHQGELDVHATDVRVLDEGGAVTHMASRNRLMWGLGLCGGGLLLVLVFFFLRHRANALRQT